MRKRWLGYVGTLLIVVGVVLVLNSFSGITGFVVLEDFGREVSGILGFVLVLGGVGMLMARAHHDRYHSRIAARVYEMLARHDAYGHHTENASVLEGSVAKKFDRRDVDNVVRSEIAAGRLVLDKSTTAVSISTSPEKLVEIEDLYGRLINPAVLERVDQLRHGHLPAGVR